MLEEDQGLLLEALSARLRKHLPEVWPRLFGDSLPVVEFEADERTVVCARAAQAIGERDAQALREEASWLARTLGGRMEPSGSVVALVSCPHVHDAMRLALEFQRSAAEFGLSLGMAGGTCVEALFAVDGRQHRVIVGDLPERAGRAARLAPAGGIFLSGEVYRPVRDALQREIRDCLVTEEYDGYRIAHASISSPLRTGRSSGFAGLPGRNVFHPAATGALLA